MLRKKVLNPRPTCSVIVGAVMACDGMARVQIVMTDALTGGAEVGSEKMEQRPPNGVRVRL